MATIKPFDALRFTEKAGDLNTLVCPPYDIISAEERADLVTRNPYNIVQLELPAGGDDRYKKSGELLREWKAANILARDGKPAIYIYEMVFAIEGKGEIKSVKGIVTDVKLTEFSEGIVLPHEETLSKAKTDRFNLMSETFCNFSQIYSLYHDEDSDVTRLIKQNSEGTPDFSVLDDDNVEHNIWVVTDDTEIELLVDAFTNKKLYIADGHHRYETALNFKKHTGDQKTDYVMMMLVNMENPGLVVFPTHRIVRDLPNFDVTELLEVAQNDFEIDSVDNDEVDEILENYYEKNINAFAMYANGEYYLFTLKDKSIIKDALPDKSEWYCGLDVSVLHTLVLEKCLGIDKENMAKQINLTYTKKKEDAENAVENGANCAFILNPTRAEEIGGVARAGEKMPQKSTYFYPKTITGLVVNEF